MSGRILFVGESDSFGGDDVALIEVLKSWPGEERLTAALNRSHRGRAAYAAALAGRGEVILLDESTLAETSRLARLTRPVSAWIASGRLARLFRELAPEQVVVNSGGFPCGIVAFRSLLAARRAGIPAALIVHGVPPKAAGLRRAYLRAVGRFTLNLCDRVAAVSEFCARAAREFSGSANPIHVLPNGLGSRSETSDAAAKRRELGVPDDGPLIGAIGNLIPLKGFDVLLAAFARVRAARPDARLALIGAPIDAEHARTLERLAAAPEIGGRAVFAGFREDAGRFAECFDVCVLPSVAEETFGLIALEAMRYGRPLVASRVGGLPETVGDAGTLVPPGNADALAAVLLQALAPRADMAERIARGRARFAERFTADAAARRWREFVTGPAAVVEAAA